MNDLIKTTSLCATAQSFLGLNLINNQYQTCPYCKEHKFKVSNDTSFKCFKPSCLANKGGSIVDLLILNKRVSSVKEAFALLSTQLGNRGSGAAWYKRIHTLTLAFNAYEACYLDSSYTDTVLEFLNKRGYGSVLERVRIGYAPPVPYLIKQGIALDALVQAGLAYSDGREFFKDRVIFLIKDKHNQIVHLQGRCLDPDEELRWLATPSGNLNVECPPITHYLFNSEQLKLPAKTVFLTEGVSDGLSLLELDESIQCVSCFGLEPKLLRHVELFSQVQNLIAVFDSDTFPLGHDQAGNYKSWHRVITHLIDLQLALPKLQVWCLLPPSTTQIKDINDWLKAGLNKDVLADFVKQQALTLEHFAWQLFKYDWSKQSTLAKLINVHRRHDDLQRLRVSIQALHEDPLEYLIKVLTY